MAQQSLPWGGTTVGDSGPYSAETWQRLYKEILGDQAAASTRGPIWTDTKNVLLTAQRALGANMSVDVAAGAALVDGIAYWNDAVVNLPIVAADATLDRIDRVVLRADTTAQEVRLAVLTGTPAASPAPPSLSTDRAPYFDIPLYQVLVGAAAASILNADLTDERDWLNQTLIGSVYMTVVNNSGMALSSGDVVVWDDVDTNNITTTTTADDPQVAGVVDENIGIAASGRICVVGPHIVNTAAAVGIGNVLCTSTTVKLATNQGANAVARALAATGGAGPVQAFVQAKSVYPSRALGFMPAGLDRQITSNSVWASIHSSLELTITTHGGPVLLDCSLAWEGSGTAATGINVDVEIDGVKYGVTTLGYAIGLGQDSTPSSASFSKYTFGGLLVPLPPGTHTFKVLAKRDSSMAGTPVRFTTAFSANWFAVREIIN